MRTISCKLEDLKIMTLHIGYEGENDYTSVRIDAGSVFAQYPEAVPSLKVQPPKGNMYPVIVTRDGDIVIWNVSDSDTASNGNGEIQLTFTENTVVVKSCTGKTLVHRSLKATGPAPDPLIDFIETAEEVVGEAQDAAEAAEAAAQHAPMIGLDGYWYKWDAETEGYVKTDTKARGEDGANGVGITSVEKISTVGLVDTYRINFTNGTNTTYTVTNGQDGSVPIDDTTPAANKVFSSAKVDEELTDAKTAIQGVDDEMDDAVFFEETQDDDSIEEIIKSEIIDKMKFSLSGVDLSIVYDGTVIDTVQLPSAQPVPCTGVELDITVTALEAEKTVTLTATLTPSNTTDTVVWSTSDDTVATVNNGVVTGVAKGTATITVTCGSFSDTCTVTVTAYFRELVLGYLLAQTNRLDYRSSYGYKSGGTFNDPFLKKVLSGQKVSLRNTVLVSGLYVYMYVYASGTFTDKCTKVGDDYVLTQAMLDMQSNDTYGILVSSERLSSYGQYASLWEGDFTAEQDCYVAFFYNINGVNDISDRLDEIKNAIRIEVE